MRSKTLSSTSKKNRKMCSDNIRSIQAWTPSCKRSCDDCKLWNNQLIGGRCLDCHRRYRKRQRRVSSNRKKEIFIRDRGRCVYCRTALLMRPQPLAHLCVIVESATEWEIDHKIPVDDGGTKDPDNLQLTCEKCNQNKGALSDSDFRALLEREELSPENNNTLS